MSDSPMNVVVVAVVGGYLLLCLIVGVAARGKASDSPTGYVAGDRSLNLLVTYFIMGATIFSGFAFLGAPGWAYSKGAASFYILAFGTLGFVPFYFLGPRAARLGRAFGFVTQGELVAARFRRPAIAGCMALVSALAFLPYLAVQIKGAGYVVSTVTHGWLERWEGAAIVYGVVLVYVLASGVLGVGWTNTLQGIFMLVLAWTLGLWIPSELYGGLQPMFERIAAERPDFLRVPGLAGDGGPWTMLDYSSAILVSAIGFSVWPHLFMKAFTARSDAILRRTVVLYPTFQLFIVPLLIVGFAGVLFASPPDAPDDVLPHLLMHIDVPAIVVGFFCAGALAASMSSGDAIVHAVASISVRDGLRTGLGIEMGPHAERRLIRVLVVVYMLAAFALAFGTERSLVGLLLIAYGPVTQLAPGVVAALYVRRATGAGVLGGLVVGSAVNVLFAVHPEWRPLPIHAGLLGLCANVAVLVTLSALSRAEPSADEDAFLRAAAEAPAPEFERAG